MSGFSRKSAVSGMSLGFVVFFAGIDCSSPSEDSSETMRAEIPGSIANQLSLGQAYDSDRATWGNIACVSGEVDQSATSPSSSVSYSRDLSYDKVMKIIAGDLEAGVKFPSVAVDAKAYYASENSTNDYRETHTLSFKYSLKRRFKLGSVLPSARGQSYIAKNDADLMRDRCKNEFVNEIDTGLVFLANMNIEFANAADKQYFGGGLSVNVLQGTVVVKGNLAVANEKEKKKVKISLRAMQDGGDASKLAGILTTDVVACDAANLARCVQGFQELIAYGNTLPQQIEDAQGTNLKVLSYYTESYNDSGLDDLVPAGERIVPKSTLVARRHLETMLRKVRQDHSRVSQLLGATNDMSSEAVAKIKKAEGEISANRARITDALAYCYQNPYATDPSDSETKDCAQIALESEQALVAIDPEVLEVQADESPVAVDPKTAQELCEKARKHVLAKGLVSSMMKRVHALQDRAPRFTIVKDWNSGIEGWGKCQDVAWQL